MIVTTSHHQAQCLMVIAAAGILHTLKPLPPNRTCDGLMPLGDSEYLVATNANGTYTVHILQHSSRAEAFAFMSALRQDQKPANTRMELIGAGDPSAN